jgi:hypothetical protein
LKRALATRSINLGRHAKEHILGGAKNMDSCPFTSMEVKGIQHERDKPGQAEKQLTCKAGKGKQPGRVGGDAGNQREGARGGVANMGN